MARITTGLALAAALAQAQPAQALSNAARYLAEQEIAAGCESGAGSFDPAGIVERDLDGDGRDDLILSHEHIICQGSHARSLDCGMQVCSVRFFVRRGELLQPAGHILGGGVTVGAGAVPTIQTYGHGGGQAFWRWNGQEVAPVN